jgi:hypothetical protein
MENSEEAPSGQLIKAGVEIVKTVYGDALQPVSKEAGKALGTLGKTINVALSPLRGLVWGWGRIEEYLTQTVERKLSERKVPQERITTPDPDIAVPAIEALRYSKLRENYANLVATAMDIDTARDVHPAFVEILKQLSPDEALILEYLPSTGRYEPIMDLAYSLPQQGTFRLHRHVSTIGIDAGCKNLHALPQLIDNLCRLGLAEIPPLLKLNDNWRYDRIRTLEIFIQAKASVPQNGEFKEELSMIGLTLLGASFRKACVTKLDSA